MLLETNQTHIEGWVLPTYTMPVCERPATPPLWLERGYGFVNQTITCWVYYTADFVRIDHVVEAEILNQSLETMTITIPYGGRELCGPEKVLASFPGDGSTGDLVSLQVNQSDNETVVFFPVTPGMAPLVKFKLIYRIFDLPGRREPTFYYEHMLRGPEYPAEYRFRKEYIYATTFTIRQGLRIANTLGIDGELIRSMDELCKALDTAAELEYSGKRKDGPILEWTKSHAS